MPETRIYTGFRHFSPLLKLPTGQVISCGLVDFCFQKQRLLVYFFLLFSVFKISGIIRVSRMGINVPSGVMTLMRKMDKDFLLSTATLFILLSRTARTWIVRIYFLFYTYSLSTQSIWIKRCRNSIRITF